MYAKALVCDEHQNFSYADVTLPDPGPEHLLIRASYSGVSIGTEFALIRSKNIYLGAVSTMHRLSRGRCCRAYW